MKAHVLYLCALSSVAMYSADARSFLYSNSFDGYASFVDKKQTFESEPQVTLFLESPVSILNFPKVAKVHFLTNDSGITFTSPGFEPDIPGKKCIDLGWRQTSCPSGTNPVNFCPYEDRYFKECCSIEYKYTECPYPLTQTGRCGGKYKCECDKSLFPIRASSCASPMIPASGARDSCLDSNIGEIYVSECVCPSNYTETCSGNHLQGKGSGCTKNGETKYTSCECESGYNLTCSDNGPLNSSDFCLKDGVKYYKECEAAYKGCPTGSVDLDNYWCNGALKCVIK